MDVADIANDYVELERQIAASARVQYKGVSATHCEECGEAIPEARRLAVPGCTLCVECASAQDLRSSRYARGGEY